MESSQESFVLVGAHPQLQPALARFFPVLQATPSSASSSLDHHAAGARTQRAQQPDHALFIDHLLQLALPEDPPQYPPASAADLAAVVARLAAPAGALVARSCLYYLALALSGAPLAHALARSLLLPPAFRIATRALYALDTADYPRAVRLLADPRVEPDFVPRTLAVLAHAPQPPHQRAQLVLGYWRLARIDLARHSKDQVKHVLRALCAPERERGVAEAWTLARDWHVEHERDELARTILEACFGANYAGQPQSAHLSALLALPFTPTEDALATSFCASPPSPLSLTLTVDWRLSKLVAESRPIDALRFYTRVRRDQGAKLEQSDARDRLLKAVEANLSDVQRSTLELDLSPPPPPLPTATSAAKVTQPAWAPSAPVAPSTPAAPPRTLAAARAAQHAQLPAPAAAPSAAELPLSASPFVRSTGQGGVLRALEHAHAHSHAGAGTGTPPRKPVAPAPTVAPGSPFAQVRPPAAVAGRDHPHPERDPLRAGAASKPTLAGFGSVRQAALTTSALAVASPVRAVRPAAPAREEDDEMRPAGEASHEGGDDDDDADDFARRAARDPAIQRTLAAASVASSSSSRRVRAANPQPLAGSGASKRRAVARRAPREGQIDERRSAARREVGAAGGAADKGDKFVRPPGAFPTSASASGDEEEDDEPEPAPAPVEPPQSKPKPKKPTTTTPSTQQTPSTARRRSARTSTAEPTSPAPTPARRTTRASSAAPPGPGGGAGAGEDQHTAKTPVRRSSRLSRGGSTTGADTSAPGPGTGRRTRAAAGGRGRTRGRIEEQSDEE